MKLNLYHVRRLDYGGYDTYSDFVICTADEETARHADPSNGEPVKDWKEHWSCWTDSPDNVEVRFLGEASSDLQPGVICASYHAG